jgi:hypothetical protein
MLSLKEERSSSVPRKLLACVPREADAWAKPRSGRSWFEASPRQIVPETLYGKYSTQKKDWQNEWLK